MDRDMAIDPDLDFDLDFDDSVARRVRGYVREVVVGLGLRGDSSCIETEPCTSAYVALDGRLPDFPDHDVALLWNELSGWSAAVEDHVGDLVEVARLGGNPRPSPIEVVRWVRGLVRTERAAEPADRGLGAFVPSPRGHAVS